VDFHRPDPLKALPQFLQHQGALIKHYKELNFFQFLRINLYCNDVFLFVLFI